MDIAFLVLIAALNGAWLYFYDRREKAWEKKELHLLNRIQAPEVAVAESVDAEEGDVTYVDEWKERQLEREVEED